MGTSSSGPDQFDFIIVGGGSAGCVLAARLSEDPQTKVCLIEAGANDDQNVVQMPLGFAFMVPTKTNNWAFETVPQPGLNGRQGYQPRGKVLGGSSSINAMLYVRGHASDYDDWAALGNSGWAYEDVLPYFKRAEGNERLNDEFHGTGGPLNVTDQRYVNPLSNCFVEAGRQLQFAHNSDFNGAQQDGFGIYQVTQKNGQRCSSAKAYLDPARQRPNLRILTNAQVLGLRFEGTRAIGVTLRMNGEDLEFAANAEVILSAGVFQSPQLLQLSGIGDPADLQSVGIRPLLALSGVGQNLQDHLNVAINYQSQSRHAFSRDLMGNLKSLIHLLRYKVTRTGLMTTPFAEAGAFLRTDPSLPRPDIQLHFCIGANTDHGRTAMGIRGFGCHMCLLRPESSGTVKLASNLATDAPRIDPQFLSSQSDLESMIKGVRLVRRIMTSPVMAKLHGGEVVTDQAESDSEIGELIRNRADTIYHPVGTCRMGPGEAAVVGSDLKVHGLEGLRVVDASIMPTLVGGNTNAPTIMIAEKAADLIKTSRS